MPAGAQRPSPGRSRPRRLDVLAVATLPFTVGGATSFQFGGSTFHAALLTALARRGHAVRVLAEAPPAKGDDDRRDLAWDVAGFAVHGFAAEYRSAAQPPSDAEIERARRTLAPGFARLVALRRPDVVLLGRESLAWYVPELCRAAGVPCVLGVHGTPTHAFLDGSYPEAARRALLERMRRTEARIAVARHLQTALLGFGVDSTVIANAVDEERFRPRAKPHQLLASLRLRAADPVVLHVSSLKPGKRPADVVASAARVVRQVPDAVYVVVGDGPRRTALQGDVRARGLEHAFRLLPSIDFRDMPDVLALCDLVVMPSEHEGASLVYLEALAAGRVLVASDIPAAREAVVDGESGLLFPVGDVDALAMRTLAVLRDPSLRARIGTAARAAAESRPFARMVDAWEEALAAAALARGA